jgi:O-antigen/teichoic acid export membrane protein
MPRLPQIASFARSYLRPEVFFSLAWRVSMAVAGLVSIYMISHRLTPSEQGYWYTFDSLAVARSVFELGFSMVLMQVASLEYPRLRWSGKLLEGDAESKARLSALLRKSVLWYVCVAAVTLTVCIVAGDYLFGKQPPGVNWRLPWYLSAAMTCGLVALTPLGALLEGTGKLAAVAQMRLVDALLSNTCMWIVLSRGGHLYAMATALGASLVFQGCWFGARHSFYRDLWQSFLPGARTFWRTHVWPFQKRIAVSFVSGYFIVQILNPMAFAIAGPVAAGRLGMTLTLSQGIITLATAVVKASAPRFGELIALRQWKDLDRAFRLSIGQSLLIASGLAVTIELGIVAMNVFRPEAAVRILGPWPAACILAGAILTCVNQALAIYLRAHKTEPLMVASIAVAVANLPVGYVMLHWFGAPGAAVGYLLLNGILNCLWTSLIFRGHIRRRAAKAAAGAEYALI